MKAKKIAMYGLALALIFVLSFLEQMLPPIPFAPPHLRLGLSNIVTMYCIFFIDRRAALVLTVFKSGFIFMMRGFTSAALSLSGGLLSVLLVIVIIKFFPKISFVAISIISALMHNLGQILALCLILGSASIMYYLPVLIVTAVVTGTVTGLVLSAVLPVLGKLKL